MNLSELAKYLERVEQTSSRLEKEEIVWEALQAAETEVEEDCILALTTCERFSNNGVAKQTVRNAVGGTKSGVKRVKELESELGSLPAAVGEVEGKRTFLVERKPYPLADLWDDLLAAEELTGKALTRHVAYMLADYQDPKWVAHALLASGGVSLGFGAKSAANMLHRFLGVDKKVVAKARALCPDVITLNRLAPDLPTSPKVGMAFRPMLASSKPLPEEPNGEWLVQPKYDGARLIAHYDGELRLFSRNLNEVTDSLPEAKAHFEHLPEGAKVILDGEAVAYKDGEMQPFQAIMTRFNRKHDVGEQEMDVRFHWFDCVYADLPENFDPFEDRLLTGDVSDLSNVSRIKALRAVFPNLAPDAPAIAPYMVAETVEQMLEACKLHVEQGYEGSIVKRLGAPYEFDKRSHNWRKVKAMKENVDLEIAEVLEGEDRNAGRLGMFKLRTGCGVDICRVGNGFTDEQRKEFWERREELVGKVCEVEWQELFETDKGWGLRFPVFVGLRDKSEADTLERLKRL